MEGCRAGFGGDGGGFGDAALVAGVAGLGDEFVDEGDVFI